MCVVDQDAETAEHRYGLVHRGGERDVDPAFDLREGSAMGGPVGIVIAHAILLETDFQVLIGEGGIKRTR